jgi:hypothetical protein
MVTLLDRHNRHIRNRIAYVVLLKVKNIVPTPFDPLHYLLPVFLRRLDLLLARLLCLGHRLCRCCHRDRFP